MCCDLLFPIVVIPLFPNAEEGLLHSKKEGMRRYHPCESIHPN